LAWFIGHPALRNRHEKGDVLRKPCANHLGKSRSIILGSDGARDSRVNAGRLRVAVRLGDFPDCNLVVRKIGVLQRVLVAHPSCFGASNGGPKLARPRDLTAHN
jgi:hypothetical protein